VTYLMTPDHDFAPEPRYSDEEFTEAHDEAFMEDPEVIAACLEFHSGTLNRESFADRIEYLSERAKDRAHERLIERESA
jgi:hypothetical protein